MSADGIILEDENEVGLVKLARPQKANAVSEAMIERIGGIFADPPKHWKAAIILGEGPHFSAGLDLSEHRQRSPEEVFDLSRLWHRATQAVTDCGIPVLAAMEGAAIGGGLELAAATHVRIAAADCRFSLPEGRRGIFVGGGASVRVGSLIGASRLVELMLTGRQLLAEEALRIGLCHLVVEPGTVRQRALAMAQDIAGNAPLSNRMILSALTQISQMPHAGGLFTESLVAALTQVSPEAKTRLNDFLTGKAR